jgi:hypothetical protein
MVFKVPLRKHRVPLEPGERFVAHDIDYLPSSNPSITDEPEHTTIELREMRRIECQRDSFEQT